MKKLLYLTVALGVLGLSACAYHSKQPIDSTYYKKTQGIAWPEESQNTLRTAGNGTGYANAGSGNGGYSNGGYMGVGMGCRYGCPIGGCGR